MPARTGEEFLQRLRNGREIWVGAERVADVEDHPAFQGAARTVAAIYDLQHEAADACLMPDPQTGEPIAVSHLIPRSRLAQLANAAIVAAENGARDYGNGLWLPDERPLFALRALLPTWFPRVGEIIRLLGSHNLLTTPSAAQLADPELRPLLDIYLRGAGDFGAAERAGIFRLAWTLPAQPSRAGMSNMNAFIWALARTIYKIFKRVLIGHVPTAWLAVFKIGGRSPPAGRASTSHGGSEG